MARHNDLGKVGEQVALDFLLTNGYEILDENWCYGKAEIDIIAYIDQQLIFVEVKTRSSMAFGYPEEAVSETKQKLMQNAAAAYIELMDHQGEVRFDIISIIYTANKYNINHIKDAFWPY